MSDLNSLPKLYVNISDFGILDEPKVLNTLSEFQFLEKIFRYILSLTQLILTQLLCLQLHIPHLLHLAPTKQKAIVISQGICLTLILQKSGKNCCKERGYRQFKRCVTVSQYVVSQQFNSQSAGSVLLRNLHLTNVYLCMSVNLKYHI